MATNDRSNELAGELAKMKQLLATLENELGVMGQEEDRLLEFLTNKDELLDETKHLQAHIAKLLENR